MSLLKHEEEDKQRIINAPELDKLYNEHPLLYELTTKDADVHAWFKQAVYGRCTVEEALIGALVHVAQAKQKLFDEVITLHQNAPPKQPIR